ncbi:MAG: phosphotransferase [Coriobacteriaceae bacterium]|nr:phosphotransferase [Coriobacteriaceae bacterium]
MGLAVPCRGRHHEGRGDMHADTWSKADLHIHSNHSDGLARIPEIMDWVEKRTDLSVIAITDHNTIEGALFAKSLEDLYGFEVIVGEEVSTRSGHIIGLWLNETIPAGMSVVETLAAIHEQGGVAIVPHPFSPRGIFGPLGRTEFLNTVNDLAFHALEVYNSIPYLVWANSVAAKMFTGGQGIAATGGSDAHVLQGIGTGCTLFRGSNAEDLRRSIENLETRASATRGGLNVALRYTFSIPRIRRQRSLNWERCKAR